MRCTVGSIFNRRHLPDLICAFAPIARARSHAALDIVGDNRTHPHQDLGQTIAREGLGAQVSWRPYVSDQELATLHVTSRAFAFLSEYEGLGLTPLEALASGIPPVLLDTSVARESCGDAALYVAAGDITATTEALERLLFDNGTRAELVAAAPAGVGPLQLAPGGRGDVDRAGEGRVEMIVANLSIVIVSYNARADLERCLGSLHDARPAVSHDITVVDNASSDDSAAAARRWADVRVIDAGRNVGFAAGNNIGIRATAGENILLLNSDTIVPVGAIDGLMAALQQHQDVAVVGPRLVDAEGRAELSFGPMLSPFNERRQRRLVRGHERRVLEISRRVEAMTRQEQWPDWVSGACLLVRRADADAVGLLDERFFMYAEDVDFCAAIRRRDRRVLFTPAVEVVHLRGQSAASAPESTRAAYYRSHLAFYEKHHPMIAPLSRLYRWLVHAWV